MLQHWTNDNQANWKSDYTNWNVVLPFGKLRHVGLKSNRIFMNEICVFSINSYLNIHWIINYLKELKILWNR